MAAVLLINATLIINESAKHLRKAFYLSVELISGWEAAINVEQYYEGIPHIWELDCTLLSEVCLQRKHNAAILQAVFKPFLVPLGNQPVGFWNPEDYGNEFCDRMRLWVWGKEVSWVLDWAYVW